MNAEDFDTEAFSNAKMIIQAELDTFEKTKYVPAEDGSGKVVEIENTFRYLNVIPFDRMQDFRDKWWESPGLRMLIRAAGQLDHDTASKTKSVRALWSGFTIHVADCRYRNFTYCFRCRIRHTACRKKRCMNGRWTFRNGSCAKTWK